MSSPTDKLCYHEPPAALKATRRKFRSYWLLQDAWPGRFDHRCGKFGRCPTFCVPLLPRKSPWTTTPWYEMIYFFDQSYTPRKPPPKKISLFSLLKIMLSPFRFEFSCCPKIILWLPSLKTMQNSKLACISHQFCDPDPFGVVKMWPFQWWKRWPLTRSKGVTTWITRHGLFSKGNALL